MAERPFHPNVTRYGTYVCPECKNGLQPAEGALHCQQCGKAYPVRDGIPDFIMEDLTQSPNPTLRGVKSIDRLAPMYESRLWYPVVLNFFGGLKTPALPELIKIVQEILKDIDGFILDAACGPGTYGRRLQTPQRVIFGIDISLGMLRQGVAFAEREQLSNVFFSRARVEALPFLVNQFDAAICCGALHLFEDTERALREIGCAMKARAPLAVMTFGAGDGGILRYRWIREHVRKDHGARVFELAELEGYLQRAGFEAFEPRLFGSSLVFSARKTGVPV